MYVESDDESFALKWQDQHPVNASDLVLLTGTVITREHNLRKCQSVWHKIIKLFSQMEMVLGF